ncbi:MAG: DUF1559 domain-containing protein [Pirellulales bacterium]
MAANQVRSAVTLVELLIVIAIIGVLVQLTIPAIQSSRETARRLACQNNLRQIGLAAQQHDQVLGNLPTAGWGWAWIGDPDRGAGKSQSGSWAYQLLPYLEARDTYEIGLGLMGEAKFDALTQLASEPVALFYCPSRRSPKSTPTVDPGFTLAELPPGLYWYNAKKAPTLARTDYSANVGDLFVYWGQGPPPSKAEKGEGFLVFHIDDDLIGPEKVTGVVVQRQPIKLAQVVDGLSQTYFAGEKYLPTDDYDTGKNFADDQSCWNGDDLDMLSSTEVPPSPDSGHPNRWKAPFGSAHPDGVNMVYCDASVHFISYNIEAEIHKKFGNRRDSRSSKN